MAKPFTDWTVLPHGKLTPLDDNLLSVTGVLHMPLGDVERRMTVVRLRDGRSIIYSAIALDEPEMRALESFGRFVFLIVSSDFHRTDVKVWKDLYPDIIVVALVGARERVEKVVPVDFTSIDFGDPAVRFVTVPGTAEQEAALVVETRSGTTLVLCDLIFNLAHRTGISGWLFQMIGLTGDEPHIAAPIRMRHVSNRDALRAQLESWAQIPDLERVIIAHGEIITKDSARVLERIAKDLAA